MRRPEAAGPLAGTPAARVRVRPVSRTLFALAVVGGILGLLMLHLHLTSDPLADTRIYYDAAARLNAGQPLYPPGARIYPPLFSILWRPLALLPFPVAATIWEGILLLAFGITLWRLGIRRPATWLGVGILGMAIAWTLAIGQAEALVTMLLTIGSPFTVALAANVKLLPILVGVYWLARRDWHRLGLLAAWTAGLILLQLVLDPADTLAFPATLTVVSSQAQASSNLSPWALSPILWALLVLAGGVAALRLGRTRWGWASAVGLAVLASPRLFIYMLMSLLAGLRRPDDPSTASSDESTPIGEVTPTPPEVAATGGADPGSPEPR